MWILPKQLHTLAYAPDTKGLGLDSEEFSRICEKSLTWRGKDSLSRTWLRRWKRESWMQRLCLRTLKPSHTERFVDAWTSSVVASRANHSHLLESVKLLKTPGTSSRTSPTGSGSADLELFSWKTLKESSVARQQTENQFSNMSCERWKGWVIEQRQEYSQRLKSAHLTRESVSSSLDTRWRTPLVEGPGTTIARLRGKLDGSTAYYKATGRVAQYGLNQQVQKYGLNQQVQKNWPTITAGEEKYRDKHGPQDQANLSANGKSQGPSKLNPNWVEQLMGLPVGWTDLGSWATE